MVISDKSNNPLVTFFFVYAFGNSLDIKDKLKPISVETARKFLICNHTSSPSVQRVRCEFETSVYFKYDSYPNESSLLGLHVSDCTGCGDCLMFAVRRCAPVLVAGAQVLLIYF